MAVVWLVMSAEIPANPQLLPSVIMIPASPKAKLHLLTSKGRAQFSARSKGWGCNTGSDAFKMILLHLRMHLF
ncbi:hypothetical protein [Paraburkholderia youngii]|uniref:hypothetical protein n=1 Tax=Paraburkholderia youngii TaxID=2782701 RepID=UPI003D1A48B0